MEKNIEEAKKIIEEEEKKNQEKCIEEVNKILLKYSYKLKVITAINLEKI